MYKPHNVTVSWLKQRSGNYALKGIRITEDQMSFDSSTSFREEDAVWVTSMLGARADVEALGASSSTPMLENTLLSARDVGLAQNNQTIVPLELERANATLLRHFLDQLIAACDPEADATLDCKSIAESASKALQATDVGTHYTLREAHAILDTHPRKASTPKGRK